MRHRPRRPGRLLAAAALAGLTAYPGTTSASVFERSGRWPTPPRPGGGRGFALIRVCIVEGSSAEQRNEADPGGFITEANPPLDRVLDHVRSALRDSWEAYGAVRFFDWRPCPELSSAEREE